MPKKARELKALEVRRLSKGTHRVGGCTGLCLSVVSETNKNWTLRVRIGLRDQEIGLGSYIGRCKALRTRMSRKN